MEEAPQNPLEQFSRNLKEEPMLTVEAMAAVEGPAWLAEQEGIEKETASDGQWDTSLAAALERAAVGKRSVIYGRGGGNRWFLETDGSVSFSESLAFSSDYILKARELGFEIVP